MGSVIKTLSILCVLFAAPVFAAPLCTTGTLAKYIQVGSCTIGPLTYSNFAFSIMGEAPGQIPVSADDVILTPTDMGTIQNLNMSANSANNVAFSVPAGSFLQYSFDYYVDPPPPIIHGSQISLNDDPGAAISVTFCLNGMFPSCPDTFSASATSAMGAEFAFPTDLSTMGVHQIITLDATSSTADVSFASIDNGLILTSDPAAVPEPATSLLIPGGLLGLLAFGSRSKLRQIVRKLSF